MAIILEYITSLFGIVEIATLLAAIFLLGKSPNKKWRFFIYYMALVVVVEVIGTYAKLNMIYSLNYIVYNILLAVQISFFIKILYSFNYFKKEKWVLPSLLFLLYAVFINELRIGNWVSYCSNTKFLLGFVCTILCCTFFYGIMQKDETIDLIKYPKFWIAVGLLAFSFGSAVIFAFYHSIALQKTNGHAFVFKIVMGTLSNILYISWIIAFLCQKNHHKSPS